MNQPTESHEMSHATPDPTQMTTGALFAATDATAAAAAGTGGHRVRCQKCGKGWTGLRIEHCTGGCHESFTGTISGDKHRVGDFAVKEGPKRRRCLTPDEMLAKGMAKNKHGVWTSGGVSPWATS